MRRTLPLAALVGLAALPAPALATPTGGAEAGTDPGGAVFDPAAPAPLRIRTFSPTLRAVAVRVDGPAGRVRLRMDLLSADSRAVLGRVALGSRRTGHRMRIPWAPKLAPGAYVARLDVRAPDGRRVRRVRRTPLRVAAPAAAAPATSPTRLPSPPRGATAFPVQGPYSFGADDARFGAGRPGHSHQGQDISAAEGTPVVSPVAGVVHWRAYQGAGAGHYLVIRSPGSATTRTCTCVKAP